MLPTIRAFGIGISTYGVVYLVAFVAGIWLVGRMARKGGLDVDQVRMLAIYTVVVSRVGGVLIYALLSGARFSTEMFRATGSFFLAFGIGLLFVVLWAWRYEMPVLSVLDCFSPPLVLGQIIGRAGCFAAGCCFGTPTSSPIGVTYTNAEAHVLTGVPLDVRLHPTQLYESAVSVVILTWLLLLFRHRSFPGQLFASMLGAISMARFILESFRGDVDRGFVTRWLSVPRLIALLLLLVSVILYLWLKEKCRSQQRQAE